MIQILLPEGKSKDNLYNINRDMAHVFDKLVRQVALEIPDDAITPKPSDEQLQEICNVFGEIFVAVTDPAETPDTVAIRLEKLPPDFRAVFDRALSVKMFKLFTKWRREIAPKKPVEPTLDAV